MTAQGKAFEAQRKRFEAWAGTRLHLRLARFLQQPNEFVATDTQLAWLVWQAAELTATERAAPAAPAWISVADRLPAQELEVMVWPNPTAHINAAWHAPHRGWIQGPYEYECLFTPTHWMPLPAGPGDAP